MNQRYILTGAPGTGKTSIINELNNKGYYCINESSREIIAKQIIIGGEILPWKNQIAFENQVANMRAQKYLDSPEDCICFFDRSAIDCIAYLRLNNLKATSEIIKNINKCSFNKTVFYTPIWKEIYVNDSERKENIEQAKKIESTILNIYKLTGHQLLKIPKMPIQERADFIISKI